MPYSYRNHARISQFGWGVGNNPFTITVKVTEKVTKPITYVWIWVKEWKYKYALSVSSLGLPRWHSSKDLPANTADTVNTSLIPESGRWSGGGNGNSLQYYSLGYPTDRGAEP